jgi:hypothetical protein
MLKHGRDARCVTADPTGGRNLHHANQLRIQLKDAQLPEKEANEVVRKSRPAFREAIHGRLTVPAVNA